MNLRISETIGLVSLAALLSGAPGAVAGGEDPRCSVEEQSGRSFIVLVDLTQDRKPDAEVGRLLGHKPLRVYPPNVPAIKALDAFHKDNSQANLEKVLRVLRDGGSPSRALATSGDIVCVFVAYSQTLKLPAVSVDESGRDSELMRGLRVIAGLELGGGSATEPPASFLLASPEARVLGLRRANVSIAVSAEPMDPKVPGAKTASAKGTIVTGPREHLFLATDLPVGSVDQVKYDEASKSLVTKTAPTHVFASLNWMFGDVLDDAPLKATFASISSRLVIKGMVEMTSKPFDGFGLGLGYRLPNIHLDVFELDALQPFGAVIWRRQETKNPDGTGSTDGPLVPAIQGGISLNIDKIVALVKKK